MNKNSSNVTYVLRLTIILLFFAVLCFPLALMAIDGPDQTAVQSEAAAELKPLNWDTYIEGTFHSSFETWFSHHYPLRSSIVAIFRDSLYRLEMSKPAIFVMDLLTGNTTVTPPSKDEGKTPGTTTPEQNPSGEQVVDPMAI